jgi:Rrf2 family protein
MKLGKKAQYAILFVLYLARAGRARTSDAAGGLGLSTHFLEQVARKLRQAGVIKSVRGPGGGYELLGSPTVGAIMQAVAVQPLLTSAESSQCATSAAPEYRALGEIVGNISRAIGTELRTDASKVVRDLSVSEGKLLDSVNSQSTVQ